MKLQSIQVLRGLAALLVVLFHIRSLEGLGISSNGLAEAPLISGLFTNGYAGVDLFFVVSGFIMVYVTDGLKSGPGTSAEFLFARITRIYPVWWLFAGAMTAYMVVVHGLLPSGLGWDVISRSEPLIPYLLKSFALVPQGEHPILGVGWTLVHEMYFYLVFTLILLLPRKWLPGILFVWGCAVVAGSIMGLSGPIAKDIPALLFYPMTMEFILGAAVGLTVTSGRAWRPGVTTLLASLWLMACLCYQGVEQTSTLEWGRVLWFGLPCAVLIYGVASLEIHKRIAWLLPAAVGMLVCAILYQLYGLTDTSPDAARRGATILSVTVGGMAMLAVMWAGWLGGQAMPERVRNLAPTLKKWLGAFSRLGDWSYSLYLCHMIVLTLLRRTFDALGDISFLAPVFQLGHPGPVDNLAFATAGVVLSITLAAYAYRYFEKPCHIMFIRMRKGMFDSKIQATAVA